jgi:glycosyltransferase involved in cell wall biosynthesis
MRVLTVARWYPSHDGPGRGTFVADLVGATAAAGVDARVVSFDRVLVRGRLETRDSVLVSARAAYERIATPETLFVVPASRGAPGVPVARLPVVRRPGTGDPAALVEDHLVALRPFVAGLARRWCPDVIHAHTGLPDGIVAAAVGRELGIPVVVTEHASTIEADLADPVALEQYRTLLGPGVRLLAVSPPVAGRLAVLLGVPVNAIGVLPNPVDDTAFASAEPSGRDLDELLWVGALGEHKGIDVLLQAVARIRRDRPKLRLRLVGGERTAGDMDRWRGLAGELGIGDAVAFDGWLDRPSVAAAMSRAGAFVHPSPSETFGVVAAEAILAGLPVASRRSGGVPWVLELSGGFGAVADGDDAAAFAAAIETVLDRRFPAAAPEARARLVAAVGATAITKLTIEGYRELIAASGPAARPEADETTAAPNAVAMPPIPARPLPFVLVATERLQSIPRVAALPDELRELVTLVVPPQAEGTAAPADAHLSGRVRIVEAAPVRRGRPPEGGGPVTRFRRATWKPPLAADQELAGAVVRAVQENPRVGGVQEAVALDAPAAVVLSGMSDRHVRLAPGSLRWLADRWDAERAVRR